MKIYEMKWAFNAISVEPNACSFRVSMLLRQNGYTKKMAIQTAMINWKQLDLFIAKTTETVPDMPGRTA